MAILHKHQRQTYTVVDNEAVRDEALSFRARGLLVYLLSLPDAWRVNSTDLTRRGTEGREAIRSAMNELEAAGYLARVKRQDSENRWSTEIHVAESPGLLPEPDGLPTPGFPTVGEPTVGSLGVLGKPERNHPEELPMSSSELASETEATRSPAQLELDGIKDALDDLGLVSPTKSGWAMANRVAVMIRDSGHGPADVIVRASLMAKDWGAEKVTLASLEKHWPRFDPGKIGTLTQADIDAFARGAESRARSQRRLREISGGDAETEAYQADVRMLRDRARSQGRSDDLDKGDYR